ncbi:YbjQ family protein [Candidatus Methanarcanum hacksteinii]|uniref:YbjQ family protein n=1 Tax=Candidatus Methanarcanum hacksteinii TaxID=2911857 RepID=UPI002701162A|nr:YbjQ family protein [Methanomassiliicoccales archaeon]MDO5838340.1 YbjQ family protein [Methanomassiliicoccales archaeon]
MMLTTIDVVPGKQYEVLGLVKGNMIQTKNFGKDIGAGLKSLVGGELKAYSDMMNEARATATKRMVAEAEALGADAIVCVRYTSASVMAGAAEILAFGTAVKFV